MNRQEKEYAQYLLLQYIEGLSSMEERRELSRLLAEERNDGTWEDLLEEVFWTGAEMKDYRPAEWQPIIDELIQINRKNQHRAPVQVAKLRVMLGRAAVAAAVLVLAVAGVYFLAVSRLKKQPELVEKKMEKDVQAPLNSHATITLADGSAVYLDRVGNGAIAEQGNIKLLKQAGDQVVYEASGPFPAKEEQYNTLFNPPGSKVVSMVLADGSRVWLDAGSSMTYPVAFSGRERKVSVTGEAYFEVAHNAAMPFKVRKGNMEVTVLGTHFNVNAYDDDENIKVTLLEGSVRVTNGNGQVAVLRPGEQARISGSINLVSNVDIASVMAWRTGLFSFERDDLKTVMRQLARWYSVEVSYEGNIPGLQFSGKMQRDLSLSEVLDGLQKSDVHFRIEGRKIIVTK